MKSVLAVVMVAGALAEDICLPSVHTAESHFYRDVRIQRDSHDHRPEGSYKMGDHLRVWFDMPNHLELVHAHDDDRRDPPQPRNAHKLPDRAQVGLGVEQPDAVNSALPLKQVFREARSAVLCKGC